MSQIPDGSYKDINDINDSALGWEVPVESVPIPSKGVLYSKDSFFYNKEVIDIKAMTAKEEDILTSRSYIKANSTLDHLIASCTGAPLSDIKNLLLGDRNALVVSIRITGYGTDYDANITCPNCGTVSEGNFDLAELGIKNLDADPIDSGQNKFSFSLPVSKKNIVFKLFNASDEEKIDKDMENLALKLGENSVGRVTHRLIDRIISIDGNTDRDQITKFVKIMPAYDSKSLRNYAKSIEPSLDTNISFKCKHCSTNSLVQLPIGKNFFWPA